MEAFPDEKQNPPCCMQPDLVWEEHNTRPDGSLIGWFSIWYMPDEMHLHVARCGFYTDGNGEFVEVVSGAKAG